MINLIIRILWCFFILGIATFSLSFAGDKCVFSEDIDFENLDSIAVFHLFPEKKEVKGVLSNGNIFSIKYWSCNHYGKHAIMVIGPQLEKIPSKLNNYILQLGEISLSNSEFLLLTNKLKNKAILLADNPITLRIENSEFDEFYVQATTVGEVIFVEIKLYKS